MKTTCQKSPRRHIQFYQEAVKAASAGRVKFDYNDWEFGVEEALDDMLADLRDGRLRLAVESA